MTIRTKEELKDLGTENKQKFNRFLPTVLAYCLPRIYNKLNMRIESQFDADKFCQIVNDFLKQNPEMTVVGFGRKINDSEHFCSVDYNDNVRTYGEAHEGINGLPSIGIHFIDPDDDWNDWIWISIESMKDYEYGTEVSDKPFKEYIEFIDRYLNN